MDSNQYSKEFSDDSFWDKVNGFAKTAGEGVLEPTLKRYYAASDPDTPVWAKAAIYAAFGYFILPVDSIPDMVPIIGFSGDLGVLCAALAATAASIKEEHAQKSKEKLKQWFY